MQQKSSDLNVADKFKIMQKIEQLQVKYDFFTYKYLKKDSAKTRLILALSMGLIAGILNIIFEFKL